MSQTLHMGIGETASLNPPVWYLIMLGLLVGMVAFGRTVLSESGTLALSVGLGLYSAAITLGAACTDPAGVAATLWLVYLPVLAASVMIAVWSALGIHANYQQSRTEHDRLRSLVQENHTPTHINPGEPGADPGSDLTDRVSYQQHSQQDQHSQHGPYPHPAQRVYPHNNPAIEPPAP